MTATNHALTGAVIGLTVGSPVIAMVAAFLSHFVCDAIPHFGRGDSFLKSKAFVKMLIVDALLCILLVLFLGVTQPAHWALAAVCAFLATSPDFLWIPMYQHITQGRQYVVKGFFKFASDIQWFERPIGGVVETVWFGAGIFLVSMLAIGW